VSITADVTPQMQRELAISCSGLVFDCDGVLLDSEEAIQCAWSAWAAEHHLEFAEVLRASYGRRTEDTLAQFLADPLEVEAAAAHFERLNYEFLHLVKAAPGASQLLAELREDSWAIATSSDRNTALARLRQAHLPIPKSLIAAEDYRNPKPAPDSYLEAVRQLRLPPSQCVAFDDSEPGLLSARAAGLRAVAVLGTFSRHLPPDMPKIHDLREVAIRPHHGGSRFTLTLRVVV
jgi:mannitol-1-/sugar-/sorbitol-6-phosphatase